MLTVPCSREAQRYLSEKDPALGAVIAAVGPIERPMHPDLFHGLADCIAGQQISGKAHRTIFGRMADHYGGLVTPAGVAQTEAETLRGFGLSRRKAEYIAAAARAVLEGAIDLEAVAALPDRQAVEALVALPGVGVWTAEMLLIFALGRPDVLSFGDLGIRRGLCALHRHRELTPKLYEKYRRRYSPYGSVASLYLWEAAAGVGLGWAPLSGRP